MSDPRRSQAVRDALKGHEPTDEQWLAISHPLEPQFLIAGAGSGKTAVMAARIAWALETQSLSPSQILGLTFTNKAAAELQERVRLALAGMHDESGESVTVQTYHAFAAGIVHDYGLLVDVEPEAGLLSEAQQWQLVLSCLDDIAPFEALEIRSSYVVGPTLGLASSVSDYMVDLSDIAAAADRMLSLTGVDDKVVTASQQRKELVRVVDAYTREKRRISRIDFGDQVTKAVEVLTQNDEVRAALRKRFAFVLLDEYQDTNVAQRRMLQALVEPGGAITAVGDARQAIFAWRGATMFNLINFPEDFPRADGRRYPPVSLSENFRSGAHILEVANQVVAPIDPERRPGDPLQAQAGNGTGEVSIGLFSDEREETTWIAEECERLHGDPTAEGREPVAWKDIAILVRRKATMDMLLQALEEKEIPVEVVGLGGLLKTPEVTEVVAWLRALESKPGANRWLGRILLGPRWRIHYRDLSLMARWAASQNSEFKRRLAEGDAEAARDIEPGDVGYALVEALGHLDEIEHLGAVAKERLTVFADRLTALRKKSNGPLLELVQEIIREAGILDALESSHSRTAASARQNISNFFDQVASFAPLEGEATLRSFIAYLDAAEVADETMEATQPADHDSVKLMTVHAAKGLEFECVFVPSVASKVGKDGSPTYSIFPNTRALNPLTSYQELPYEVREDREHLPSFDGKLPAFTKAVKERAIEDERRLFYVALTRAKQRLAVTASWWYGRDKIFKGPSPFWQELDELAERTLVKVVRRDEQPEENPLFEAMGDRREWPPQPRIGLDDPLFPDGWGRTADELVAGAISLDSFEAGLTPDDREEAQRLRGDHGHDLGVIAAAVQPATAIQPELPDMLSATSYVSLVKGDLSAWDLIRPLPQRPTAARRIGTEVHRLIEERSRGMSPFPDEAELDEPSQITVPSRMTESLTRWQERYGDRTIARLPSGEPMIEVPFTLKKDGMLIRGRIDAVYETDDGGLEIVDFKTGRRFERSGEADQLEIYAEAMKALGLVEEGQPLKLTYEFLADLPPASARQGDAEPQEDWSA
jgi:DNA helicase II / ATP-dependent DNA helicase PcrA